MERKDIKRALARIRPSDELVDKTIKRAYEAKYTTKEGFFSSFNFRLASTVCALTLIICIGVLAGANGFITEPDPVALANENARSLQTVYHADSSDAESYAPLVEDARRAGGEWIVAYGEISAMYVEKVDEDGAHLLIQIDNVEVCDHNIEEIDELDLEFGAFAKMTIKDDSLLNSFLSKTAEKLFLRMYHLNTEEELCFEIVDFLPKN